LVGAGVSSAHFLATLSPEKVLKELPMKVWRIAVLLTILVTASVLAAPLAESEGPTESNEGARLESALEHALANPQELASVRIEADGRLAPGLHFLTLYGRGIGFWNRERQFELSERKVKNAIQIILRRHLCRLPEHIGGEEEPEDERHPRPLDRRNGKAPRFLLRALIVTAGSQSRTIVQETEVPEAKPLVDGLSELAALCRKPAAKGRTATSLEDGLTLVAQGKLAPEALTISVNAPELRSLKNNSGQGWTLRIEHGRIHTQSQELGKGYVTLTDRPMEPNAIRRLAKELLNANAVALPNQVSTPGYLHLRIGVLSHSIQVMARTFAGTPTPESRQATKTFASVRALLRSSWKESTERSKAAEREMHPEGEAPVKPDATGT